MSALIDQQRSSKGPWAMKWRRANGRVVTISRHKTRAGAVLSKRDYDTMPHQRGERTWVEKIV